MRGICGGWSCRVEQGRYGHPGKKATWLYAYGVNWLPSMRWGFVPDRHVGHLSWAGSDGRPALPRQWRSKTPEAFRDALITIASFTRRSPSESELTQASAPMGTTGQDLSSSPEACQSIRGR